MTVFYLARHGQSEWNREGRIQGRLDSPLTEAGREQAREIARTLRPVLEGTAFDLVSSPLGRAVETARIIASDLGRRVEEVIPDERLTDFELGEIAGTAGWDEVARQHPELARLRLEDPLRFRPPGGESGADVIVRVEDFLAERERLGRPVLVIGHGVINKFMRSVRLGITGSGIIALGEAQDVVYRLKGNSEREIRASGAGAAGPDARLDRSDDAQARVPIGLGERSYEIVIGSDLLERARENLEPFIAGRKVALITDPAVADLQLPRIAPVLDALASSWFSVTIDAGEGAKSFAGLEALLDDLLEGGLDRNCVLVALGGGVVGDLTGFAAAVFMRGIDFVQIPTTLMAQVDSAVGGKNAINARQGKNLIGTFHQPRLVLNDVSVLASLPDREMRAGYAEIVKYGLLRGERVFAWLEANAAALLARDPIALVEAVRMGCETKGDIVSRDERDRGDRALVNLGHTFAHAIEADAGYGAVRHGEAVAAGLAAAVALSARLGHCQSALVERVRAHLRRVGLPGRIAELESNRARDPRALYAHMMHDKKTVSGRINFVLLRRPGGAFVSDEPAQADVLEVLESESSTVGESAARSSQMV